MVTEFVSYYRVSTSRQGESGLGLDAQRQVVHSYIEQHNGILHREFTEVESGKANGRPKLQDAIAHCQTTGSILLIAKLDRLARKVSFIANLLESGVRFVAVDMPNADRFMLHVYAAMAEEEGRRISERTKAALAAAQRRGVQLGKNGKALALKNQNEADEFARGLAPTLRSLIEVENLPIRVVAERLNELGFETARSGTWHPTTVHRAWKRINALTAS